jgi:lipopolysaccharide transport system ATP-binding protein
MSDTAILVENISKQYRLGQVGRKSINHDVNRWWHKIRGKEDPYLKIGQENDRTTKGTSEYVWALKDINFKVRQGEVLGIIGRNGAGKSTLLKILSKVTAPSTGVIKTKGKVASLLEVGTGFHPDLSGRDNIYLNGAILGMTKKETTLKFDEIVDFAGVERYIDTPVKRYSSGMYVRLAFAVAAHLEPEILVVDEVLAVGDAEFQKKCLGKMKDVSEKEGRTILFVSHNMDAIARLCNRGLYLKNGKVVEANNIDAIISRYLESEKTVTSRLSYSAGEMPGDDTARLVKAEVINQQKANATNFRLDEPVGIEIYFEVLKPTSDLACSFNLYNYRDIHILTSHDSKNANRLYAAGRYSVIVWLPPNLLTDGVHGCGIAMVSYNPFTIHFNDIGKLFFNMIDVQVNNSIRDHFAGYLPGIVRPSLQWGNLTSF